MNPVEWKRVEEFGRRTAILALIVGSLYLPFIDCAGFFLTENPFMFCTLLSLWLLVRSLNTAHSLSPVPLIVTMPGIALRRDGILADVAPTVLELLGIEQPAQMTGHSLIEAG